MVPWQTLITGIVGMAGIGGTILAAWMTGKRQTANLELSIGAENERHRLTEKRRIYAACQASFENMLRATIEFKVHNRRADPPSSWVSAPIEAGAAMNAAISELRLVAPIEIGLKAEDVGYWLWRFLRAESDSTADYLTLNGQLYMAMRADLGESTEGLMDIARGAEPFR